MKKVLLAAVILLIIGGGAFFYLKKGDQDMMGTPTPTPGNSSGNTPTPSSSSTTYKDGTYTGNTVQADRGYGPIQVKAVISGGKLTDVIFLQMPGEGFGHTQEVTDFAKPLLKQEAIAVQSSQVDIVSGATQDTEAFQKSLASALAQAN